MWAVGYSGVTTRGDTVTAPALVTAGPYAYVRNPLYAGNFLTAAGFALALTGKNSAPVRCALVGGALARAPEGRARRDLGRRGARARRRLAGRLAGADLRRRARDDGRDRAGDRARRRRAGQTPGDPAPDLRLRALRDPRRARQRRPVAGGNRRHRRRG